MVKLKIVLGLLIVCCATTLGVRAHYTCDLSIPVKGKTLASKDLQQKSLFTVYSFAYRAASNDCQNLAIKDTKVTKQKSNDKWEELWTVNACKSMVEIPVIFTESNDKSTYAVDYMRVKVKKQ